MDKVANKHFKQIKPHKYGQGGSKKLPDNIDLQEKAKPQWDVTYICEDRKIKWHEMTSSGEMWSQEFLDTSTVDTNYYTHDRAHYKIPLKINSGTAFMIQQFQF